jgi:hypothetical protein
MLSEIIEASTYEGILDKRFALPCRQDGAEIENISDNTIADSIIL